jgi:uncharacterized membrane protein YoaK (UPF0700 family)
MISHRRRERIIAAFLAALAGYFDVLGFLKLGALFVSFMSGSSTRLGVGLEQRAAQVPVPASLIGLFVVGIVAGSFMGHVAKARRRLAEFDRSAGDLIRPAF